ncbi:hypothetical protein OHD16_06730 [Sphingobacterium sp. ML3W]|uniref:hypothetical protein n=1 Tax=Sphingobacterium sp. ML3W TaxID=1538644 RepID=UPI00249A0774|nr:hypothetical protein [Sphingobacterium sp. ML3W]WFA79664.1 hypothetical protein OGI71_26970 [Sphingobacterium sp. ML3W]
MATLDIEFRTKGFAAGEKQTAGLTTSLEKLEGVMNGVSFESLTKHLQNVGIALSSATTGVNGLSSALSSISSVNIGQSLSQETINQGTKSLQDAKVATEESRKAAIDFGAALKGSLSESLNNVKLRTEESRQATETYKQALLEEQKAVEQSKSSLEQKKKELVDSKVAIDNAKAATESQRLETEKSRTATQQAKQAIAELAKANKENAKNTSTYAGSYDEAQRKLTNLGRAIKSAAGGFIGADPEIESKIKQYNDLNTRLKNFDAQLGNNQRNVGNYASALKNANGVALEFNRIIQDAPFGMIGIGNNLQQLSENWKQYSMQVRSAAAENGKTVSNMTLLKGALGSIVSPINLATLGISLATAGWTAYTMWQQKANKATKETKTTIDDQIKTLDSVSRASAEAASNYSKELTQLNYLYGVIQSGTSTRQQQNLAVEELQKLYPNVFNNLSREAILAEEGARAYDKLRDSIVRVGIAEAAKKLGASATEDYVKNVVAGQSSEKEARKELHEYNRALATKNILEKDYAKFLGQTIKVNGVSFKVQKDNSLAITQLNTIINDLGRKYTDTNNKTKDFIKSSDDAKKKIQEYNDVAIQNGVLTEKQTGLISELTRKIGDLESKRPFLKTKEDIAKNVSEANLLKKELKSLETVSENQVGLISAVKDKLSQLNKDRPFLKTKEDIQANIQETNKYKKELADLEKGLKKTSSRKIVSQQAKQAESLDALVTRISGVFDNKTDSGNLLSLEGLDKIQKATENKYQQMINTVDTIEKQGILKKKGNQDAINKITLAAANERAEILKAKESEISQNAINFAEARENKLNQLYQVAGMTRTSSREKDLQADKIYWDSVLANAEKYGISAEQVEELRRSSMAQVNKKWDGIALDDVSKLQEKIIKIEEKPFKSGQGVSQVKEELDKRLKQIEDFYNQIYDILNKNGLSTKGINMINSLEIVTDASNLATSELSRNVKNQFRRSVSSSLSSLSKDVVDSFQSMYDLEEKYAKLRKDASSDQIAALNKMMRLEKQINNGISNIFIGLANSFGNLGGGILTGAVSEGASTGDFSQLKNLFKGDNKMLGYGSLASLLGGAVTKLTPKTSVSGQALGGALAGAGSGALLGAAISGPLAPIGAAVGAVLGAVGGILSANKANKQRELEEQQLLEQKRTNMLLERQQALAFTSSITGQATNQGIVTGVERNEFGDIVFEIEGRKLKTVIDRENLAQGRGVF